MAFVHFRMFIHELLNKDSDILLEEYPIILLDGKSAVCMANNGKDTKHTRHIARRIHYVRNGEIEKCTRLTVLKKIYNWQTFPLIILVRMI